jgi:8-demethyl-8-(2-methoxy-alpha-L-rhamnosyl)tetracenomycin-C 3'-O-methyltransferase
MNTLNELGLKHGTDKASGLHHYLEIYERFLGPLRDKPITLLEMGTLGGNSLRMWDEYFTHPDTRILGLELEAAYWKPESNPRMKVINGSQADPAVLRQLWVENGEFDVVIDDASHKLGDMKPAFEELFPHVKSGGFYCLEDLHTSWWPEYNNNGKAPILPWLYEQVDEMSSRGRDKTGYRYENVRAMAWAERYIKSVTFFKGLAIVERA